MENPAIISDEMYVLFRKKITSQKLKKKSLKNVALFLSIMRSSFGLLENYGWSEITCELWLPLFIFH